MTQRLEAAVEAAKSARQKKKKGNVNAWQAKKQAAIEGQKMERVGIFNPKKYDCWIFPAGR